MITGKFQTYHNLLLLFQVTLFLLHSALFFCTYKVPSSVVRKGKPSEAEI